MLLPLVRGKKNAFFSTFWINFMECHCIQFTTISINVERGIVKILFKYRYFQNLLIDIDIFQNHHIDIDIDIFGIALSISIFFKSVDISTIDMSYRYIEQGYICDWYKGAISFVS